MESYRAGLQMLLFLAVISWEIAGAGSRMAGRRKVWQDSQENTAKKYSDSKHMPTSYILLSPNLSSYFSLIFHSLFGDNWIFTGEGPVLPISYYFLSLLFQIYLNYC